MSAKKNDDRKSIVVVGGGSAGVNIARPLSSKLDAAKYKLVLINPRPFRILLPATLRAVVSDVDKLGTTEAALVPFDKIFHGGNGLFLQDSVHGIHQNGNESNGVLTLGSGEQLPYDILILATGLSWPDPIAFPESVDDVKTYLAASHEKFAAAESYLLVGGGAVGCELAGELKDIWPGKDVTIVHGQRLLFNDAYPDKFRKSTANHLTGRGIKVVLDEIVEDFPTEGTIVTQGGLKLSAGLIVKTTGASKPNTAFINSLDAGALTSAGFVKVKPTLQLLNYPNIFAAGDIVEWKEQKQAIKASAHAQLVTKNILSYINGGVLKNYSTAFEAIVLTNGKRGGLSYFGVLWGIILGAWFTRWVKSKSLLIPMFRKESGLF